VGQIAGHDRGVPNVKKLILNYYPVHDNLLFAGEYPGSKNEGDAILKLKLLNEAGIKVFLDLTEDRDNLIPYGHLLHPGQKRIRFPIRDGSVPQRREIVERAVDTINMHLEADEPIYVHCWGGIGRTGLLIGCWLSECEYPGRTALERLEELWNACPKSATRSSPETQEQREYIINWTEVDSLPCAGGHQP
jgi:hypothetical protein